MNISGARILEIGDHDYFKFLYPEQTTFLWTGYRAPMRSAGHYQDATPRRVARALADVKRGRYDLVVTYSYLQSPWHPRYWLRALGQDTHRPFSALTRVFGVAMLRFAAFKTPMIVIDMSDVFTINRANFFLLDRAAHYFKRELPVDHWQAFYGSAHPNLPTYRVREDELWRARVDKLRPVSLQKELIDVGPADEVFAAKTAEVFFAGEIDGNSTVRRSGFAQLERLAARGVRVDLLTGRIPRDEFYRRMSRSWLAWSPSGRGWDCYRHYEAPQCFSVPVINYPTIERHRPLDDGVHAIYYAPEGDRLMRTIEEALCDKERLKRIALAGHAHVRAHHIDTAFCDDIFETVFGEN